MTISIEGLTKHYGDVKAVDDITFEGAEGEITSLLGPSGCGKTTTLRSVAGLETPEEGVIRIGDRTVSDPKNGIFVPPQERDIGFVFQMFDVWPHMTVFENVSYPLEYRSYSGDEIEEKVMGVLELTGIEELRDQPATQLSGGQQARVGICRSIVYEPEVLLLDEPLTGLDKNLRKRMQYEIQQLQAELDITMLYVTHSQSEAMALSDRICLMNPAGRIDQRGTPVEIYRNPQSEFAFEFFGSSEFIPGELSEPGVIDTEIGPVSCSKEIAHNGSVKVGLRPENVNVSVERPTRNHNQFEATLRNVSYKGQWYELVVEIDSREIQAREQANATRVALESLNVGSRVYADFDPDDLVIFPVGER